MERNRDSDVAQMNLDRYENTDYRLTLALDGRKLQVSYVSSTLRVLQAALRDFARNVEEGEALFSDQPQPVLLADAVISDAPEIMMELYFADPEGDTPMKILSTRAFEVFMSSFGELLKRMPQRDLWGAMSSGSGGAPKFERDTDRRLNELRTELRHFRRAVLMHQSRAIAFDGDQLEIE